MNEEIKNEILAVREIAIQLAFDELADFLSDRKNHKAYCNFILTGK